jgi:hypothetical protein
MTLALQGCALIPSSIPIQIEHVSHLTQHEPFTSHPTGLEYNSISAGLKWTPARNLSIKITEGVVLGGPVYYNTKNDGRETMYGDLLGPREVFSATVEYDIPLK